MPTGCSRGYPMIMAADLTRSHRQSRRRHAAGAGDGSPDRYGRSGSRLLPPSRTHAGTSPCLPMAKAASRRLSMPR